MANHCHTMLSKAFGFGAPAVELEKLRAVRQRQELSDGNQ
jgi:hypothetical protein